MEDNMYLLKHLMDEMDAIVFKLGILSTKLDSLEKKINSLEESINTTKSKNEKEEELLGFYEDNPPPIHPFGGIDPAQWKKEYGCFELNNPHHSKRRKEEDDDYYCTDLDYIDYCSEWKAKKKNEKLASLKLSDCIDYSVKDLLELFDGYKDDAESENENEISCVNCEMWLNYDECESCRYLDEEDLGKR